MTSPFDPLDDASGRRTAKRRVRRVLGLALAASLAAHAAVLVWMPRFAYEAYELTKVSALEVILLKPEPLPVEPADPAPARPPSKRAPESVSAKGAQQRQPERHARAPVQLLTVPESSAVSPPPPPSLPEPQPARPTEPVPSRAADSGGAREPAKTEVAHAALTPPSFSASYLRNPPPRYPIAARRAGEQGTVTLRVLVTREGLPARVDVEKTSGSSHLDNAALETVKTWRFRPARQGTEAVESWVLVPIVFRLEGSS